MRATWAILAGLIVACSHAALVQPARLTRARAVPQRANAVTMLAPLPPHEAAIALSTSLPSSLLLSDVASTLEGLNSLDKNPLILLVPIGAGTVVAGIIIYILVKSAGAHRLDSSDRTLALPLLTPADVGCFAPPVAQAELCARSLFAMHRCALREKRACRSHIRCLQGRILALLANVDVLLAAALLDLVCSLARVFEPVRGGERAGPTRGRCANF